jgi:hypothetical protein
METIHHTTRGGQVVDGYYVAHNYSNVKFGHRTNMRQAQHYTTAVTSVTASCFTAISALKLGYRDGRVTVAGGP